jgi:hypothetical protein
MVVPPLNERRVLRLFIIGGYVLKSEHVAGEGPRIYPRGSNFEVDLRPFSHPEYPDTKVLKAYVRENML